MMNSMKKLTFIGDVHGKVNEYKQITDNCDCSICVGDFGFKKQWEWLQTNPTNYPHYIVPGNHDYIPKIHKYPYTGNYDEIEHYKIFMVRGADSIDKHLRTEGLDWFADEELNYKEQLEAFDFYCKCKPRIVVSHDCPQSVMQSLFGYPEKSQTRNMLEAMFNEHKPELWVFGHFHQSKDVNILGTRFVCLDELETLTIEI